ncbi:MAG: hypothetical protein WC871_03565 [Bacteroidales bacterium]|jgi:hypothetical protein
MKTTIYRLDHFDDEFNGSFIGFFESFQAASDFAGRRGGHDDVILTLDPGGRRWEITGFDVEVNQPVDAQDTETIWHLWENSEITSTYYIKSNWK